MSWINPRTDLRICGILLMPRRSRGSVLDPLPDGALDALDLWLGLRVNPAGGLFCAGSTEVARVNLGISPEYTPPGKGEGERVGGDHRRRGHRSRTGVSVAPRTVRRRIARKLGMSTVGVCQSTGRPPDPGLRRQVAR